MKKLSYHEVLKFYYDNIHHANTHDNNLYTLLYFYEDNSYTVICYDNSFSVFMCSYINSRGLREGYEIGYAVFGKHQNYKNEYFLYPKNYKPYDYYNNEPMLPLPETSDEWFNFTLMNNYTEDDFKIFKKIVQYYENK